MNFDIEYFKSRSTEDPETGCWNWTKGKTAAGYGVMRYAGRAVGAHRVSLGLRLGLEPTALKIARHQCDNPSCVNPNHLVDGTQADNAADAKRRGRFAAGSRHGQSKLSEDDAAEIRYRCRLGEDRPSIAALFGVDTSVVSEISTGRAWSHA